MLGVSCSRRVYLVAISSILVLAACQSGAGPDDGTTVTTSTPATSTTALIPATTTTEPTTTTTRVPTTAQPEVSERQFGFAEAFAVTVPTSWSRVEESTQQILYIEAGANMIVFAISDRATVDEWRDYLTGNEGLTVSEPAPADIGGAQGFTTELRLGPEATDAGCQGQGRCVPILSGFTGWVIVDGYPNQVWVVDVDGRPVFIAAEASENSFETFVATVEEALETLVWASGS